MTTANTVGAVSREAAEWYAIDWPTIQRNVRRLQVRIVQATKESRWGKVKSLQRLLTHSYSGKVLAVRRVTENNGKKTPGVDQMIWKTPEDKTRAVHALKSRGYQSQPLRRVYIPKSDGKTMRPLGIPCMIDRAHQALHLLALDPVLEIWVVQQLREAWAYNKQPHRFLLFDRDAKFVADVVSAVRDIGSQPTRTTFRSPWQNGVAERWVGSCRCDLLNHVIILNERHLKRLMSSYLLYYHEDRTHLGLAKDTPAGRPAEIHSAREGQIQSLPRLGGLHHRYAVAA